MNSTAFLLCTVHYRQYQTRRLGVKMTANFFLLVSSISFNNKVLYVLTNIRVVAELPLSSPSQQLTNMGKRSQHIFYARIHWISLTRPTKKFASAYNNVHWRMPAYKARARRRSSVPLMYTCVCKRVIIRWYKLMPYHFVWLHLKWRYWTY